MIENINELCINDNVFCSFRDRHKYTGENNLVDIITYLENEMSVYLDRNVIVDTDDDDYYPTTYVLYEFKGVYRPSWSYKYILAETDSTDEAEALVNCVEYSIDNYHTMMEDIEDWEDEDSSNPYIEYEEI